MFLYRSFKHVTARIYFSRLLAREKCFRNMFSYMILMSTWSPDVEESLGYTVVPWWGYKSLCPVIDQGTELWNQSRKKSSGSGSSYNSVNCILNIIKKKFGGSGWLPNFIFDRYQYGSIGTKNSTTKKKIITFILGRKIIIFQGLLIQNKEIILWFDKKFKS